MWGIGECYMSYSSWASSVYAGVALIPLVLHALRDVVVHGIYGIQGI